MVCMNDYNQVNYTCTYLPCGYTESFLQHKHDFGETKHCPKCKLFTLSPDPFFPEVLLDDETIEKIGKQLEELSNHNRKGRA